MSSLPVGSRRKRIKALVRRDDTIRRLSEAFAGTFMTTWAADDTQFIVFSDGVDIAEPPTRAYHSLIYKVVGDPLNFRFEAVPAYPDMPLRFYQEADHASFWGKSCLAVDGCVYHALSTSNKGYLLPDGSFAPDFFEDGVKLIYSPDNGVTWHNQDGSTPVVLEKWEARSRDNMLFFGEGPPEGAFSALSFLQMGKDYSANRDGYVYAYASNGGADGSANQLVLCRVPKAQIRDRRAYEFFAGSGPRGDARWTRDIAGRAPVHTFPTGWVSGKMLGAVPSGWWSNVVYNEALGLYMMVATGTGCEPGGGWFTKPNYLGVWVASAPWGTFEQIHEERAWTPANEPNARAYAPQIPPKWIAADGSSFWMVWSDYGMKKINVGEEFNPDREGQADIRRAGIGDEDRAGQARFMKAWAADEKGFLNMCLTCSASMSSSSE